MLRIDETSGTLVAPQAGGLVTENSPERDELLGLIAASWEAFAQELGMPNLRLVGREPAAGADLLAFDEQSGRAVVLHVTGETVEWQISRALGAVADVAGWDAARLAVGVRRARGRRARRLAAARRWSPAATTRAPWPRWTG